MKNLFVMVLGKQNLSLLASNSITHDPVIENAARKLRKKLASKRVRSNDEKLAAALAALRSKSS